MTNCDFDFDWVDAFTDRAFGGNACVVVQGADDVPVAARTALVRETSLSECAYLVASDRADFGARYYLAEREIDHLHSHFASQSCTVAMLAASLAQIPFSYTLHGPADLYEPYTWHLAEKTARAKFVACISHFARSQAMFFSDPRHWGKLHVIHCGVIPDRYDRPATSPDSLPARDAPGTHLLFVGRLSPVKGLRVLLEAFAAARAHRPDLTLTLVGDGEDRVHLERRAAPFGDAVRFAGFRSQEGVARALAAADALVLPSFAEGLPVVLMEALAAGKPVIGTQVAGVAELVETGVSGFIVPAGDADSLARAIRTLADDPERAQAMGAAGREKVRAEFDIRREAARIGSLFAGTAQGAIRPDPYGTAP